MLLPSQNLYYPTFPARERSEGESLSTGRHLGEQGHVEALWVRDWIPQWAVNVRTLVLGSI